MTSGYPYLPNIPSKGLGTDLMNTGEFCFSCEQIFSSRKCLEEHLCPVPSFICSCGTEFILYKDMLKHSSTHEPGHKVLCHETIKKRRIEKHIEQEEKLQRLQSGEIVWESPKSLALKGGSQVPIATAKMPQAPVQPPQLLQVPNVNSQAAPPKLVQNASSTMDTGKIFSDVGAPTVDLWTLFQPVVVVQTVRSFCKTKAYTCGKCGQSFETKKSLVLHHNMHVADKISGCIGCGLLLSSRKIVPRFHSCNAPHVQISNYKFKLITARPLNRITTKVANGQGLFSISSPLKIQNHSEASKISKCFDVNHNTSAAKQQFNPVQTDSLTTNANISSKNSLLASQSAPSAVSQPAVKGYECRVCCVSFESISTLQRHKCAKAHEYLMKNKLSPAYRQRQVMSLRIPNSSLKNSQQSVPSASVSKMDIQSKIPDVDKKETVVLDDDCFIVESGPEKPAEVIYQVTSSVPIKT